MIGVGGPAGLRSSADESGLLRGILGGITDVGGRYDGCRVRFWAEEQALFEHPAVATTRGLLPSARTSLSATLGTWTGITQGVCFSFSDVTGDTWFCCRLCFKFCCKSCCFWCFRFSFWDNFGMAVSVVPGDDAFLTVPTGDVCPSDILGF